MTRSAAEHIRGLLGGNSPNGALPEDFGEWAPAITVLQEAWDQDSTAGVRRAFEVATRQWPDLRALVAADAPPFRIWNIVQMWEFQGSLRHAWRGWMLQSNITLIGGVSGVGKSTLLLAIVSGYLNGTWPDGSPVPDEMRGGNVVYCTPEGYGEQTELLLAWGHTKTNLARRIAIPAIPQVGTIDEPNFTFKIDSEQGSAALGYYCEALKPKLIIVDGLRAAMTGDESASADVDKYMGMLVQLAARYQAAVLITHHLTKGAEMASRDGTLPSKDWFRGSGDIVAKVRSAWIVDIPNMTTPTERRITLVKASAGPDNITLGFSMTDPADGLTFSQQAPRPPARSKKEAARTWILGVLRCGPMTVEEMDRLVEEELDISAGTMKNTRQELKAEGRIITLPPSGEHRVWRWALPVQDDEIDC